MTKKRPNNTALMIFSLSVEAEGQEKILFGRNQKSENRNTLEWLINRTVSIAEASGLPTIWIDEKKQIGDSFGERFTNAFSEVFAAGYENIIAIGNDSPDLSVEILAKAKQQVEKGKTVLGPTFDGGDYLIGLNRDSFDPQSFQKLPWNTHGLHDALFQQIADTAAEIICLNILADIDDSQSLKVYLQHCPKSAFACFIKYLLQKETSHLTHLFHEFKRMAYSFGNPLRAPPFASWRMLLVGLDTPA